MGIVTAAWILGGLVIAAHDNGNRHKAIAGLTMALAATAILLVA